MYCITFLGADDGSIKLWDLRSNKSSPIFTVGKNEDYISDIITNDTEKYIVCSSGDGSLTTLDLENRFVNNFILFFELVTSFLK